MKTLVLYMPVLHAGYLQLIEEVQPDLIEILGEDVLQELPEEVSYVAKKDILRAVPATRMVKALRSLLPAETGLDFKTRVTLGTRANLLGLAAVPDIELVFPEEDVSNAVIKRYFSDRSCTIVKPPAPRLRYERNTAEEKKLLVPDRRVALSEVNREMMQLAEEARSFSPDWWRQVGGVLRFPDGKYFVGYNEHQPHEQIAATFGDPRSLFKSGVRTDLSHGDHAEHVLVGEAARQGLSTDGSELYLTTFPCLACSRLIVRAGVRRLFYRDPSYGLLDADAELRRKNMELIEVSE